MRCVECKGCCDESVQSVLNATFDKQKWDSMGIANNMPELKKVENMFERVHWSLGCTSVCGAQTNGC